MKIKKTKSKNNILEKTKNKKTKLSIKLKHSKKNKQFKKTKIFVKLFLIAFLIFGFYYTNSSYSNEISLLAVSESSSGQPLDGSIVKLILQIKPGSGKIDVDLNTVKEIDTQISIINSQKTACDMFSLDCNKYDFKYTFEGSSLVLKGPSASAAIAILVAKTLNFEPIDKKVVITGALNSGGIIGNVGGVDTKIKLAETKKFQTIIIPVFSEYNETQNHSIHIIKAMDLIDAYNVFNGKKYKIQKKELDKKNYNILMSQLGELMCERTIALQNLVNKSLIEKNSTNAILITQAEKNYNISQTAYDNKDYYSMGSFCYNANINYRLVIENQKHLNETTRDIALHQLSKTIISKYLNLSSDEYKNKIKTRNDVYVYLILIDRVTEAQRYINDVYKLDKKLQGEYAKIKINQTINSQNSTQNKTNIGFNLNSKNLTKQITIEKERAYAYSIERLYTVQLWKKFMSHEGKNITNSQEKMNKACYNIKKDIEMKNELLKSYGLNMFNDEIESQDKFIRYFNNDYLCVYKNLEMSARLNTVLNSFGVEKDKEKEYAKKLLTTANSRISKNSGDNFPLIPYIYYEYSNNLLKENNLASSMLFANYALSYSDLDLYLQNKNNQIQNTFTQSTQKLFDFSYLSLFFLCAILILIGFL